jgi:hypothetical protein
MNDTNKPLVVKTDKERIHNAQLEFAKAVVANYDLEHSHILHAALLLLTAHVEGWV